MRATWLLLVVPLIFVGPAACGDDSGAGPDGADFTDGGLGPDADSPDPPAGYPFDEPSDFDHAGCGEMPGLDQVPLLGIWHLDMDYDDFGSVPRVLRFADLGAGPVAFYSGTEMGEPTVTAGDILIRLAYTDDQERERIYALNICAKHPDGSLSGRYAGCTDGECAVASFDMFRADPLDEPIAEGITVISEYNGPAASPWPVDGRNITVNVRHLGTTAYLARYQDGLRIVDLSDPAQPSELGHIPVTYPDYEIYNDIKMVEANDRVYALCASNLRGVVTYDVTDPANPTEVAAFPPVDDEVGYVDVHTLFIDGTRAYLANTTYNVSGLDIYDVSDPTSPTSLGRYVDPDVPDEGGFVHDLYVKDGRVYLNYWNQGMVVLDAQADPANPTVVGIFDDYERRTSHSVWVTEAGGKTIAVHGGEDFGAHVRIIDLGTAPGYQEIGSFQTRAQVSVHNIMAIGDRALVTYYQDGFRVLDLSNPAQPTEIAHLQTWPGTQPAYGNGFYEGAIGVDYNPDTDHVYLADTHRGLFVLRLDQ